MANNDYTNKWKRNLYFVLASIGASVGLGNLWRFPYMAYDNGGGAFFIPYVLCLVLVGVPLILFEISVGRWGNGSIVSSFHKHDKKTSWIGWWVLMNSMVIVFYYAIVLSWSLQFVFYSIDQSWGNDAASFFTQEVLSLTDSPFSFGNLNVYTFLALLVIWILVYFIVKNGTNRISKVLLITVPLPFLMLVMLAIRSITLDGGIDGVSYLVKPNFLKIGDVNVWKEAMSQVILSLGLGMGQMVAYSSKRKDDNHTIRSSFQIAGFDFLFSILAGFAVFGTLGFLAYQNQTQITELGNIQGLFLAFVTYPTAISQLPLAALWGIVFFLLLVLIGIDSAFAVIEANLPGFEEINSKISKKKIALILCVVSFIGGTLFTFGNGLYWLDIVDNWVANYMILSIVALECFVLFRNQSINEYLVSIGVGKKMVKALKLWVAVIVPAVLLFFVLTGFYNELKNVYGGYPLLAIIIGGWGVVFVTILVSVVLSRVYNKRKFS